MLRYVLPVHIHPLMNKTSYYLESDNLMAHIYIVGPASARDYGSGVQATASGDLSLRAPHDTLEI